jgi:hypothetical protein
VFPSSGELTKTPTLLGLSEGANVDSVMSRGERRPASLEQRGHAVKRTASEMEPHLGL